MGITQNTLLPVGFTMNEFERVGYVKVTEMFEKPLISIVSEYFENKLARGEIAIRRNLNTEADPTSISYYADPLIEVLLKKASSFVSKTIQEEVIPTYSYFRVYRFGEKLSKHVDRESCEVSVTVNVALTEGKNKIYMQLPNQPETGFELTPGDAVIYKGCEVTHWREPLEQNQILVQFMLHYVKKNGPYAAFAFDGRSRLGADSCR